LEVAVLLWQKIQLVGKSDQLNLQTQKQRRSVLDARKEVLTQQYSKTTSFGGWFLVSLTIAPQKFLTFYSHEFFP